MIDILGLDIFVIDIFSLFDRYSIKDILCLLFLFSFFFFRAEHVAKALIHILSMGKSGSVWMVENGEPPREVNFPKY